MPTFAVTSSDDVLDAVNYAITNIDAAGNVSLPGNVLVGNAITGIISFEGNTQNVYAYQYQFINVRYANSADGTDSFSTSPTNRTYYGLRNSANASASGTGPADYVWYQATGGFGTDKYLFYSTNGGKQALFSVANAAPTNRYIESVANTTIDLDVVSSAFTQQVVTPLIYQRANSAPATPTGGTYNFATLTLTPPTNWYANIPTGNGNTVWSSQNTFESPLTGNTSSPTGNWTVPVATFTDGANGVDGGSNFLVSAYAVANVQPATPTANTGSWNFSTSTGTPPTGNVTWSLSPSDPAGNTLWESTAVASIVGTTGTANNLVWSTPFASGSAPGTDGVSVYYYSVFQNSASTPATPNGGYYDFGTGVATPPSGWANSPTSPGNLLMFISTATALSGSPTGNVSLGNTWSTPAQFSGNVGSPGTNGINGWTANVFPAIVNYPMLANGQYTPANTIITATFTDGVTTDSESVYGNINASGTLTYSPTANVSANIAVSQISSTPNRSLTLVFTHTPSGSSATSLIQASPVPFANTNSLGGTRIYNSDGTLISTVSSAPVATVTYSAGQFFTKNNAGVWSPTPVANVISSTANVVVTRNNVIQAFHRYYVYYDTVTNTYTTPLVPLGGGLNVTRFTQGAAVKSATYLNVPITYVDTDGTTTVPITSAIVLSGQNGNTGPQGNRGFLPMAYVVTPQTPVGASQANLTAWFSASRTANTAPIGTGYTPITGDTAVFTFATGPGQPTATYTYNAANTWATANAQVINGDVIVTGTITSNKLNVNDIYAINVQSTNADIGNVSSNGYWLQANTGDARFGGNVSIGNFANIGSNLLVGTNANIGANLVVGNNANIGGNVIIGNFANVGSNLAVGANANIGLNLRVGNNANIGGNLVIGNAATIGANLAVGANANIGLNLRVGNNANIGGNLVIGNAATIGTNLTVGNNASIGGNLTVSGLITSGNLLANTVVTNTIVPSSVSQATGNIYATTTATGTWTPGTGVPSAWFDLTTEVTISPTFVGEEFYIFSRLPFLVSLTATSTSWDLDLEIRCVKFVNFSPTNIVTYQYYDLGTGVSGAQFLEPFSMEVLGIIDVAGSTLPHTYKLEARSVSGAFCNSVRVWSLLGRNMTVLGLKR